MTRAKKQTARAPKQRATLFQALRDGSCRWERLTNVQLEARKIQNQQRQELMQDVYFARKKRTSKKRAHEDDEDGGDGA